MENFEFEQKKMEAIVEKYKREVIAYLDSENPSICTIQINRPTKLNASNENVVKGCLELFRWCATNDQIRVVIWTGGYQNKFFSSGNDMMNILPLFKLKPEEHEKREKFVHDHIINGFQALIDTLIDFPKPIIAAVNGNALGMGMTTLLLCDFVYAVKSAKFYTPFSSVALTPEGCSTFTFPLTMGLIKANEVLLLDKQITAQQAKSEYGFVLEVYENGDELEKAVKKVANQLSMYPPRALQTNKMLIRTSFREQLKQVNARESKALGNAFNTDEAKQVVQKFLQKSKL